MWEHLDVTQDFQMEYRAQKGIVVPQGYATPAVRLPPTKSIGLHKLEDMAQIDGYFRFGDGIAKMLETMDNGTKGTGWYIVCKNPKWFPKVGGFGPLRLWAEGSGPLTGGQAGWEEYAGGWAIVCRYAQWDWGSGILSWNYPQCSGHTMWTIPKSWFRFDFQYWLAHV